MEGEASNSQNENYCDGEDNDSTASEEFEPKLRYIRMANDLKNILTNDSASCVAVHPKFVCIGTAWGIIHLVDHQGNSVRNKELKNHSVAVNQISIDANGDYIASCSDDGKVYVNGLYSSDNNHDLSIGRLVRSIAIDPNYYKSGSGRRFITGDERLVLHEKSIFSRPKSTVLADASHEGGVKTMKWSPGGEFLVWASHIGFRVYDLAAKASLILIQWSKKPQVDMKCHIYWKDNFTFIVGWVETVWICKVEKRETVTPMDPSPYQVKPVSTFHTDFLICGVGPLSEDIVILGCVKEGTGERPQLHIVLPEVDDYSDISTDFLSLRGYQQYSVSEYSLECLVEEGRFVIVSPKDIVAAYPYDPDDSIDWLIEHNKFENALDAVVSATKPLERHTLLSVGKSYIDHLIATENYDHAALLAHQIIGKNRNGWETVIGKFAQVNQLRAIAEYLPYDHEHSLSQIFYEMALFEFLKNDPDGLLRTVKKWSRPGLFRVPAVINAILNDAFHAESKSKFTLVETLAILYSYTGEHDRAIGLYIKTQNKGVFELIRSRKLYAPCQPLAKELMNLDTKQALDIFMDNKYTFNSDDIVSRLDGSTYFLYLYLDTLDEKKPKLCQKYHTQLVKLYADFAPGKLLRLLKKSDHFSIQEALDICERRNFYEELVYLLDRIGNLQEALNIIMKRGDIVKAIDFCKDHDDQDLWENLINDSIKIPEYVTLLLKKIATYVDPRILVQRIDNNFEVPGLKSSLVKMLKDYNLQVSIQEGYNSIIATDYFNLHDKIVSIQQKGTMVGYNHFCGECRRKIIISEENSYSNIKLFNCNHIFHENCLPKDAVTCRICTTEKHKMACK